MVAKNHGSSCQNNFTKTCEFRAAPRLKRWHTGPSPCWRFLKLVCWLHTLEFQSAWSRFGLSCSQSLPGISSVRNRDKQKTTSPSCKLDIHNEDYLGNKQCHKWSLCVFHMNMNRDKAVGDLLQDSLTMLRFSAFIFAIATS